MERIFSKFLEVVQKWLKWLFCDFGIISVVLESRLCVCCAPMSVADTAWSTTIFQICLICHFFMVTNVESSEKTVQFAWLLNVSVALDKILMLLKIRFQAPRPSAGPHKLRECLPLIILMRNRLKYALNYDEVKKILKQRLIKVDNKVRTDVTYPAGFMGTLMTNLFYQQCIATALLISKSKIQGKYLFMCTEKFAALLLTKCRNQ